MKKFCRVFPWMVAMMWLSHTCGALSLEDERQIVDAFATTNKPSCVEKKVYVIYTNVWRTLNQTDQARAREIQYAVLTNAVAFRSGDVEFWSHYGMDARRELFRFVFTLHCTSEDRGFVNSCANFMGAGLHMVDCPDRNPFGHWFAYNSAAGLCKSGLIEDFGVLLSRYEKFLPEEQLPAFRTNIAERAQLTPEQCAKLWGPKQEDE